MINKRICCIVDFTVPVDQCGKIKESEKNRQILRPCQRTEKSVEHECQDNTNSEIFPKPGEETGGTGNQWEIKTIVYSIAEIG